MGPGWWMVTGWVWRRGSAVTCVQVMYRWCRGDVQYRCTDVQPVECRPGRPGPARQTVVSSGKWVRGSTPSRPQWPASQSQSSDQSQVTAPVCLDMPSRYQSSDTTPHLTAVMNSPRCYYVESKVQPQLQWPASSSHLELYQLISCSSRNIINILCERQWEPT